MKGRGGEGGGGGKRRGEEKRKGEAVDRGGEEEGKEREGLWRQRLDTESKKNL